MSGLLLPTVPRSAALLAPVAPTVVTPVGVLEFHAGLDRRRLPGRPTRAHRLPGGAVVHRWETEAAELELLLCPFEAGETEFTLPVDACWGAVWQLRARTALRHVELSAGFSGVPADVESGYDGGQAVAAVSLSNAGTELTLGGSDEEEICARAADGRALPRRWAAHLDDVYARSPRLAWGVEYLDDHRSLAWTLPPFEPGDEAVLHAAVSWRTPQPEDPEDDMSPWWAVLVQPERILAAATGAARP
ncbi:hypothetical protein OH807_32300 [Kitasatospora sp. NBC_01560]|uniref:hypothetical protein n=1 Tax=Kitasatospora sp. NBC_01560 TaxID=2975965 RepID=UPI00386C2C8E